MPQRDTTETRAVTLVDIPLVRRLVEKGVILDSELVCTRDVYGSNGAVLSSILLPPRGLHTLLARSEGHNVIGQFRLRSDQPNAQILYIAPGMEDEEDDTAWLHILDAMAREAGRHNAHTLIAEVDEDCTLFETMRSAGFAVYARQQLWVRLPGDPLGELLADEGDLVTMTAQQDADLPGIYALFSSTVPRLVQQITAPSSEMAGLIYRVNDRVEAYVSYSEGRNGVYVLPYIHPDVSRDARAVLRTMLHRVPKSRPVYVCLRRHQDWLGGVLEDLNFHPGTRQAVMVRHITAGIRMTHFDPVHQVEQEFGLLPKPAKPPTRPLRQTVLEPA